MPAASAGHDVVSNGAIVPATTPEKANCTNPCSDEASPRIAGNKSSNSNVIVGIIKLLPSVTTVIGNTCHGTDGGTHVATSSPTRAPANMQAKPAATVRGAEMRPAMRPDIAAPVITPVIIGMNSHAKPQVDTPSRPKNAGAPAM